MINRRKFITTSVLGSASMIAGDKLTGNEMVSAVKGKAIVISTWDAGLEANKAAWKIIGAGGRALDAVEQGVMVTEASQNCCVGLGANPDRD
ncbi:MAG: glycosylasparaginase, partial [Chitinophagaceae bacterium]